MEVPGFGINLHCGLVGLPSSSSSSSLYASTVNCIASGAKQLILNPELPRRKKVVYIERIKASIRSLVQLMVMINPLLFIPGLRLHLVVSSRRLHCVLLQYLLRKQQEGAAEVVVTLILPVGRRILPLMVVVRLSSRLSRLKYLNLSEFMRKRLSLMRPPTPTVLP